MDVSAGLGLLPFLQRLESDCLSVRPGDSLDPSLLLTVSPASALEQHLVAGEGEDEGVASHEN